jgi:hypothetical protein
MAKTSRTRKGRADLEKVGSAILVKAAVNSSKNPIAALPVATSLSHRFSSLAKKFLIYRRLLATLKRSASQKRIIDKRSKTYHLHCVSL